MNTDTKFTEQALKIVQDKLGILSSPMKDLIEYQIGIDYLTTSHEQSLVQIAGRLSLLRHIDTLAKIFNLNEEFLLEILLSYNLRRHFIQIHGDLNDGNTERYGKETIWYKYGPAQGINTGDGVHALARFLLFDLEKYPFADISKILYYFDKSVLEATEGEYLDIQMQESLIASKKDWQVTAEKRRGAELAGLLTTFFYTSTGNECSWADLVKIGTIIQATEDIIAFCEPEQPILLGRLSTKKKNFTIINCLEEQKSNSNLREIGEIYMKRVIPKSDLVKIKKILTIENYLGYLKSEVDKELELYSQQLMEHLKIQSKYSALWQNFLVDFIRYEN